MRLGVNRHSADIANIEPVGLSWASLVVYALVLTPICSFLLLAYSVHEGDLKARLKPYSLADIINERDNLWETAASKISGFVPSIKRQRSRLGSMSAIAEATSAMEDDMSNY